MSPLPLDMACHDDTEDDPLVRRPRQKRPHDRAGMAWTLCCIVIASALATVATWAFGLLRAALS